MNIEDTLYPFLKIYDNLPINIKFLIGKIYNFIPKSWRYGNFYTKYRIRIISFEGYSYEEISKNEKKMLLNRVNNAIRTIPFYNKYNPIHTFEEFTNLPIIEKENIKLNFSQFYNKDLNYKALKANTGGSSGNPFSFFIEKGITRSKEAAQFDWYWGKYDYKAGDKILMIRGKPLKNNRNYEYQPIGNKLIVSCYNLNKENIALIYEEVKKFNPRFVHAYPSSLLVFAKELKRLINTSFPSIYLKAIFLGSESILKKDEDFLTAFFNTKVVNWYGHSECLIFGSRCDITGHYHFHSNYGYLELIDDNGNQVTTPNQEGQIIATGFDNNVMPLIRYNTGDLGVLSNQTDCECGFKGKSLSSITGRSKDYIILKDETKLTLTAFIFGQHHEEFDVIKEMQIIQNEIGKIEIMLVLFDEEINFDFDKFKNRLIKSVTKNNLTITINIVNKIAKTHRGKHKLLVQNLEI
ncbi:MAG: hypothetical protein PHV20_00720 [Bacteroidales bacterium]|nr:hypothetical protein [Bacteroidales bacterium]